MGLEELAKLGMYGLYAIGTIAGSGAGLLGSAYIVKYSLNSIQAKRVKKNSRTAEGLIYRKYTDDYANLQVLLAQPVKNQDHIEYVSLLFETCRQAPSKYEKSIFKLTPVNRPYMGRARELNNRLIKGSYIKVSGYYDVPDQLRVQNILEQRPTPYMKDDMY